MNSFKPHLLIIAILVLIAGCLNITTAATSNTIQVSSGGTIIYSAPLRHIDFETRDFSQIPPGDTWGDPSTSFPTLVTDMVHSGTYAAECSVGGTSASSKTSELRMWSIPPKITSLYYSLWIYVQSGYEVVAGANTWNMICEWYAPPPVAANQHVGIMMMTSGGVKNNLYFHFYQIHVEWGIPGADPAHDCALMFSNVSMPTGRRVHFETFYRTDLVNGVIQVKMDDQVILDWRGRTEFYPGSTTDIGYSVGNYCGGGAPAHSFWFDDLWIDSVPH